MPDQPVVERYQSVGTRPPDRLQEIEERRDAGQVYASPRAPRPAGSYPVPAARSEEGTGRVLPCGFDIMLPQPPRWCSPGHDVPTLPPGTPGRCREGRPNPRHLQGATPLGGHG